MGSRYLVDVRDNQPLNALGQRSGVFRPTDAWGLPRPAPGGQVCSTMAQHAVVTGGWSGHWRSRSDVLRGPHLNGRVVDAHELSQPTELFGRQRWRLGQSNGQPPLHGVTGWTSVAGPPSPTDGQDRTVGRRVQLTLLDHIDSHPDPRRAAMAHTSYRCVRQGQSDTAAEEFSTGHPCPSSVAACRPLAPSASRLGVSHPAGERLPRRRHRYAPRRDLRLYRHVTCSPTSCSSTNTVEEHLFPLRHLLHGVVCSERAEDEDRAPSTRLTVHVMPAMKRRTAR
jgi:hypothetical protein